MFLTLDDLMNIHRRFQSMIITSMEALMMIKLKVDQRRCR